MPGLQVISEIYGPPPDSSIRRPLYIEQDPQKAARAARLGLSLDVIDETLGWGNLVMAEESAYTAATATATNGASVRVAKQIESGDGRLFLVESLAFASLQHQFLGLPPCMPPGGHASLNRSKDAKFRYAGIPRLPSSPAVVVQPASQPGVPATTPKTALPLQARIAHRPTGVFVDYIANLYRLRQPRDLHRPILPEPDQLPLLLRQAGRAMRAAPGLFFCLQLQPLAACQLHHRHPAKHGRLRLRLRLRLRKFWLRGYYRPQR
jgi:hypothetical protein